MASAINTLRAAIENQVASSWRGTSTGTVLIDQANVAVGDATVHMDGITVLPIVGEVFTVAGDTTTYTITSVSVLTGTDADIGFSPVAAVAWANDAAVTFLATPINWDGVAFTQPNGPWIKPRILWGEGRMVTGGSGVIGNRFVGILSISFFGLPGKGKGALYGYCDTMRDAFSRALVGAAQFFAPSGPRDVDPDDASEVQWEQVVITIPFEAVEA